MELLKLPEYEISDDTYYLFACGELKVREREFLEKHQFERLLSTKNIEGFIKVLQETYYSRYLSKIEENESFDSVIISELSSAIKFLMERLKPQHWAAIKLLILEEELHNIKLIVKSKILGKDLKNLFIPLLYSYEQLKYAVENEKYEDVNPDIVPILQYATRLLSEESDYRLVELKLEIFYLENLFNSIASVGSKMLEDLLKHTIDILNIENICRYKFSQSKFSFSYILYPNGFLGLDFLNQFEGKSIGDFVVLMKDTIYGKMVEKGVHCLFDEQTFTPFEVGEDLFYFSFFESIKYSISNLEKIMWFFYRKKIELRSLNTILMGVIYNISKDRIKSRVLLLQ